MRDILVNRKSQKDRYALAFAVSNYNPLSPIYVVYAGNQIKTISRIS